MTILTDRSLQDFSTTSKYFHLIVLQDARIADFTRQIRLGTIQVRSNSMCVSVGNNQIPLQRGENLGTQIKKMIQEIRKFRPLIRIYILGLLPRPDNELELQHMVKSGNAQLAQAARDVCRLKAGNCEFLAVSQLFLEKVKYTNDRNEMCVTTRIVRPLTKYFLPNSIQLNNVGVEFIRSFLLDKLGIIPGSCPWKQLPVVVLGGRKDEDQEEVEKGSASEDPDSGSESDSSADQGSSDVTGELEEVNKELGLIPGCSGKTLQGTAGKDDSDGDKVSMDISPKRLKVQLTQKPGRVMGLVKSWEAKVARDASEGTVKEKGELNLPDLPDEDSDLDGSSVVPIGSDELDL